jgi:hypothetical protein
MDTASRPRHQDDDLMHSLTDGRLNIEMDEDAKVHWAETVDKPRYRQFTISGEPWALWWKDKKVCMNLHSTFYTATCGQASLDYWENMGNLGMERTDID